MAWGGPKGLLFTCSPLRPHSSWCPLATALEVVLNDTSTTPPHQSDLCPHSFCSPLFLPPPLFFSISIENKFPGREIERDIWPLSWKSKEDLGWRCLRLGTSGRMGMERVLDHQETPGRMFFYSPDPGAALRAALQSLRKAEVGLSNRRGGGHHATASSWETQLCPWHLQKQGFSSPSLLWPGWAPETT